MDGQQMDPLMMAMMRQRGQAGGDIAFGGGPQLVEQQQQHLSAPVSLQSGGGAEAGAGMAQAGSRLMDAYRQRMAMDEQAAQAGRQKLMIEALRGGITPGVGPGGMGSTSYGGPR